MLTLKRSHISSLVDEKDIVLKSLERLKLQGSKVSALELLIRELESGIDQLNADIENIGRNKIRLANEFKDMFSMRIDELPESFTLKGKLTHRLTEFLCSGGK